MFTVMIFLVDKGKRAKYEKTSINNKRGEQ